MGRPLSRMQRGVAGLALLGVVSMVAPAPASEFPTFVDVAAEAGIHFKHETGATGRYYSPEFSGAGICVLDYDGDGWMDLYAVNGAPLPGFVLEGDPPRNALYRNNGDGSFTDVTADAGVGDTGYGMTAVAGDVDNDGDTDLYVGNFGSNVFYRNNGDGTFTDITEQTGTGDSGWSAGCAFADYDGDGDLDLYVANYLDYQPGDEENAPIPYVVAELQEELGDVDAYAGPLNFPPAPNRLYRNKGDGTFVDVAPDLNVQGPQNRGMGIVWGDFDNDGDPDLYVGDDEGPNSLYRNDGPWPGGSFLEIGLLSGTAYDADGGSQSTMGVAVGDYNNDGRLDIATTSFQGEAFSLYRNDGYGLFADVAIASRTARATRPALGWGVCFADVDADGYLDLFKATGHVQDGVEHLDPSTTTGQRNLLFRNLGNGEFSLVGEKAGGPGLMMMKSSRGAVCLDYDNDGDIDFAVLDKRVREPEEDPGGIALLRNDGGNRTGNWLVVSLAGSGRPGGSNRDAVGARVEVWTGETRQIREVRAGDSYQSQSDRRLHVGVGAVARIDSVVVRWPAGGRSVMRDVEVNRFLTLAED